MTRPACAAPAECCAAEPVWRRWYVPLVAAALAIVGLIIAAVVALEMVSRVPERSAPPATPQVEELLVSEPGCCAIGCSSPCSEPAQPGRRGRASARGIEARVWHRNCHSSQP